jgi:hypothetical protein
VAQLSSQSLFLITLAGWLPVIKGPFGWGSTLGIGSLSVADFPVSKIGFSPMWDNKPLLG